jgi:cysteine synthase
MDRPGGLAGIGGTPVVQLVRMTDDSCAEVWVKMEAANPTGSYKDRMALAMIEAAEADGRLQPVRRSSSTPAGAPARRWRWCAR